MASFILPFKRKYKKNFDDLELNSNWKFKPFPLYLIKWPPIKIFVKLHKSLLLLGNIVKGTASDLREFLKAESPWKLILFISS